MNQKARYAHDNGMLQTKGMSKTENWGNNSHPFVQQVMLIAVRPIGVVNNKRKSFYHCTEVYDRCVNFIRSCQFLFIIIIQICLTIYANGYRLYRNFRFNCVTVGIICRSYLITSTQKIYY